MMEKGEDEDEDEAKQSLLKCNFFFFFVRDMQHQSTQLVMSCHLRAVDPVYRTIILSFLY